MDPFLILLGIILVGLISTLIYQYRRGQKELKPRLPDDPKYKKGVVISTRADGSQSFKPFVDINGRRYFVKMEWLKLSRSMYYTLDPEGFAIRTSEAEAMDLLNTVIREKERRERREQDGKIVKVEEKIIS